MGVDFLVVNRVATPFDVSGRFTQLEYVPKMVTHSRPPGQSKVQSLRSRPATLSAMDQ
jgi:hypothetical protein